jgi:ethanolaminephosphotransferase
MSSTASNYDITKLVIGQIVAALALICGSFAAVTTIEGSVKTVSPFAGMSLLYGIMMFASSYVEEEQHFWYWATTAWLMLLWLKRYVSFLGLHYQSHSY